MPDKNETPPVISADALGEILDDEREAEDEAETDQTAASDDNGNGESEHATETTPPAQPAPSSSGGPAPAQQPLQVVEIRRFGPPDRIPSTDEILGRPVVPQRQEPQPPPPDSMRPADGRATRDPLAEDRERPEKKGKGGTKDVAEVALRNLLKEYPSTKLVNVRIFWRNPRSGEYRYKGSRKNVDINEIRRPDNIVAPYGKDWIVSFQPIEARWDDPKSWQSFQFDRDGPEPKEDWTIDAPPADGLFLEVDGMGQIGMNDLKELIMAGSKAGAMEMLKQVGLVNPQGQLQIPAPGFPGAGSPYGQTPYGQPYGQPPPYMQPPPPPPPAAPVRDVAAEEREKELRETIKRLETGLQGLTQRAADTERAAAERIQKAEQESRERVYAADKERLEAQHKAEVEALKSSFQSAMEGSKSAMESIAQKLSALENRPPPPPPPPAPQTDIAAALVQVAPHLKDIFTASRSADAETAKIREQTLAAERQREADERVREREREREERERERDRRRQEEDRNREEMRERREAFERENMRMREEAQRTLDLYRTLGEQSANNARMIADMFGKQGDPSGTMSVIKMATDSMTQQMQLFAAMVKNGILGGGGPQQANFDWGRFAEQGLNMLTSVGATYAESKARASVAAAKAAQIMAAPPSPPMAGLAHQQPYQQPYQQPRPVAVPAAGPAPAQQSQQQPQQPQQPPQAGAGEVEINPLTPFVHGVNQSINKKEPPEKVADKIAGIVHIAQSFGELEKNRTLKALMENPESFLKRAYPDADPAYLQAIAQQLMEMFPAGEGEEEEGEGEGDEAEQPQQAQAQPQAPVPVPQPPSPAPTPSAPRPSVRAVGLTGPQVVLVDATEATGGNGGRPQPVTPQAATAAPAPAQAQVRRGPGRPRRHPAPVPGPTPVPTPPQVDAAPTPVQPEPEPPTGTSPSGANAG